LVVLSTRELILDPSPSKKIRRLSFNTTQSRVVFGLLTGHLHLMGLTNSRLCRMCGLDDGTSPHIFCKCEALASHRRVQLSPSFTDPEDNKSKSGGHLEL
jgi:hypothetical protein